MLIADPEHGKTSIVLERDCAAAFILSDVTGKGLQFVCQMNSSFTHFIINDMLVVMGHGRSTRDYFFAMLAATLEEGIRAIAGPMGIISSPQGGRRGMIGCVTSTAARDQRHYWYSRGLARRMVPFHYKYSEDLVLLIKAQLDKDFESSFHPSSILKVPTVPINVSLSDEIAAKIRFISDQKAKVLGQLGISLLKNYRRLARAHSLTRGWRRPEVLEEDVEFLKRIDPYVDWNTPAIL